MESVARSGSTWAEWDDAGLRLFYGASGLAERERLPYLLWTLGAEGALRFWHCRLGAVADGRTCEWFESTQRLALAGVFSLVNYSYCHTCYPYFPPTEKHER